MKLEGKVAIVTGAGRAGKPPEIRRGFGPEICKRLALQGADIVVNDFTGSFPESPDYELAREGMNAVAEEIKALGRRAIAVDADVGDATAVDNMVKKALAEFGHIDIPARFRGEDCQHSLHIRQNRRSFHCCIYLC